MSCVPTVSVDVLSVPSALALRLEVPRLVDPSKKVTVPVGVTLNPSLVAVAVKVTDWPKLEGFWEEVSVVVVGPRLVLRSTETAPGNCPQTLLLQFPTTTSGLLSPLRSATPTAKGVLPPGGKVCTGFNVPSPLPKSTPTLPPPPLQFPLIAEQFTTTTSGLPSPSMSATLIAAAPNSLAGYALTVW